MNKNGQKSGAGGFLVFNQTRLVSSPIFLQSRKFMFDRKVQAVVVICRTLFSLTLFLNLQM